MLKKIIVAALLLLPTMSVADEGMWLPMLINQKIGEMHKLGCKLSASDIYSVNKACLKDAVMLFGTGCTGEMISYKGLLITNHHCGYSAIQYHSTIEHDYLKDGFWAMDRSQELPCPGYTVTFMRRMEDVTELVLAGVTEKTTPQQRQEIVAQNQAKIIDEVTKGTSYTAQITPIYYGNQYILFVNEVYKDIRLVAAPPSAIGKFGGDTDNWMWPRHTGDFSMFRVYAGKDNKPAEYSKENVPYEPKKALDICVSGIKEGDFTMVYGYPGHTQEYALSSEVRYQRDCYDQLTVMLRSERLKIMNHYQSQDQAVRIMYSAKNASISNGWKKWQGEQKGLFRLRTVEKKEQLEKEFSQWAKGKPEYDGLVQHILKVYEKQTPYRLAKDWFTETAMAAELPAFANKVYGILVKGQKEGKEKAAIFADIKKAANGFYKNYYLPIDRDCFIILNKKFIETIPQEFYPDYIKSLYTADLDGMVTALAKEIFENSLFVSKESLLKAMENEDFTNMVANDPANKYRIAFGIKLEKEIYPVLKECEAQLNNLYRPFMRGLMEFDSKRVFFPDANLTLRIAYGTVQPYSPSDAIDYKYYSTLEGIMQKDNPEIFDYNIPQRLRDIYKQKDYGRWEVNGTVPVAFIATNHTTGGNSGSPVLNKRGALLGLNFDRVWESTMSDLEYDPEFCRNITVDIRYVLFTIEKIGGASYLFDEMNFTK